MANVLIIESDEGTRYLYKTAISFQKLEAKAVKSAAEGLEILSKEAFDLVLLDIMTPDLKDVNLIKELQEKIDKLPLIIITDLREKNNLQEESIFGACEYLSKKDTTVGEIIKRVRTVIDERK